MVQGRRLRLLAVLSVVCLLPIVSLIYTYRTYHPSVTRGSRSAVAEGPVAGEGGEGRAIASAPTRALSRLDPTPEPVRETAPVAEKMSAKTAVENAIANRKNRTVIFSKSYCPYCRRAKQLLDSLDEKYDVYELDQMDEGSDWQAYLAEKTGQRTVPSIFIDGEFIGGCSDLEAQHRGGKLKLSK
ncbi:hypothetical protein JCM3774_001270 [Rhodotorula dairenensis]